MIRLRSLALVACLPLAAALTFPVLTSPAQAEETTTMTASARVAVSTLDTAIDAVETGDTDVSMALLDLTRVVDDLPEAEQDDAQRVLARPDGENGSGLDGTFGGTWSLTDRLNARTTCKDGTTLLPFCVHWVPAGGLLTSVNAATATEVQQTVDTLKTVWRTQIGSLGYRRPAGDGTDGNPGGETRSNLVDVYLSDLSGYLGYAVCETGGGECPGYLVLENDYEEYAASDAARLNLRRVTAAHEFFHLVQYAYDAQESAWLMESTANWMEEQVYDGINDNRGFIKYGSLPAPRRPLDTANGRAEYGNWVFHQLYAERLGRAAVRDVWTRAAQVDGPSWRSSLQGALAARGSNMRAMFSVFGAATNAPARYWSEGSAYPKAGVTTSWTLGGSHTTGSRSHTLGRFSSSNFRFVPAAGLGSGWKLRVSVDTPGAGVGAASLVVHWRDGRVTTTPFRLNAAGDATLTTAFSAGAVSRVVLNLGHVATSQRSVGYKATTVR